MELGEAVGVGVADVASEEAPSCDNQDKKTTYGWKARVNDYGADGTKCSGANLYEEKPHGMWARKDEHLKDKVLGVVPKKEPDSHWASKGLAAVTPDTFPLQAHHLIPKNFLPKHDVCVWLCQKWTKHKTFQLTEDTQYNTDHANNGYAMPYATKLKEWKKARSDKTKTAIAFRVMELTGIQLHQGSHAEELDPEKIKEIVRSGRLPTVTSVAAGGDEFEQAEIHEDGYLNQIEEWLNAVASRIDDHVATCTMGCKKSKSGGKTKVRPLQDSVRLMNRVSYIAKVFLTMNIIFTCPYGAAYAVTRGLLRWDDAKSRYYIRKETSKGIEDLTVADLEEALAEREG